MSREFNFTPPVEFREYGIRLFNNDGINSIVIKIIPRTLFVSCTRGFRSKDLAKLPTWFLAQREAVSDEASIIGRDGTIAVDRMGTIRGTVRVTEMGELELSIIDNTGQKHTMNGLGTGVASANLPKSNRVWVFDFDPTERSPNILGAVDFGGMSYELLQRKWIVSGIENRREVFSHWHTRGMKDIPEIAELTSPTHS